VKTLQNTPATHASARDGFIKAWHIAILGMIILAGICARAWLQFSTPYVPGMNGGYYLVQARAVIEKGAPGIPDLPLTFALQGFLALVIKTLTGKTLESSILLAVKLADSILPPLAACPVFLIGMQWSRRFGRGPWLALACAACVAWSAPALSMVGDFEKNSLGLMWMAWLLWALLAWMNGSRRAAVGAVALLGLVGLTHISVFGTALVLVALVFAAHLVLQPRSLGQMPWRWIAGSVAAVTIAGGVVFWKFDPARIERLLGAIKNPTAFLQGGGPGGPGGMHGGPVGMRPENGRAGGDNRRPGPMGGPPGMPGLPQIPGLRSLPSWAPQAALMGMMGLPFLLALRRRNGLLPGDRELVIGCALGVMAITGPWVGGDKLMRLALNAVIPGVIAGQFAFLHIRWNWLRGLSGLLLLGGLVGGSVPLLQRGGHPILSTEALQELQAIAPQISNPAQTLVSAQHGSEWWTAWFLHTHVAQPRALRADDWKKFDVLFLEVKRGAQMGPGPGGFGPRSGQRPGDRGQVGPGPDNDFGPPPGFQPPNSPDGMGGPMMGPSIPSDAKILHDGTCLRLARVAAPPRTVLAMEGQPASSVDP
jgi:hypothetical protein